MAWDIVSAQLMLEPVNVLSSPTLPQTNACLDEVQEKIQRKEPPCAWGLQAEGPGEGHGSCS